MIDFNSSKPKKPVQQQNNTGGFVNSVRNVVNTGADIAMKTNPIYYGFVKNPIVNAWKKQIYQGKNSLYNTLGLSKIVPTSVDKLVRDQQQQYLQQQQKLKRFNNGGEILSFKKGTGKTWKQITSDGIKKGIKRGQTEATLIKDNNVAAMQRDLYTRGYFGNISRKKAIDGKMGPLTRAAMRRAKKNGLSTSPEAYSRRDNTPQYTTNPITGQRVDANGNPVKTKRTTNPTVAQESVYGGIHNLWDNQKKFIKGKTGFFDFLGNQFDAGKDIVSGIIGSTPPARVASYVSNRIIDNMYPYSYGDIIYKGNESKPYMGGKVPEGWSIRQTTADDTKTDQLLSMAGKYIGAIRGKDPRRQFMEDIVSLDLDSEEGRKKYNELIQNAPTGYLSRYKVGNPVDNQYEQKVRLELANRYGNRGYQLQEFEENPEYNSPTAESNGASTYRLKDPVQRERIYKEMGNYFLKHSKNAQKKTINGKTVFILPSMGFLGNHSLIADDRKGTNLRYGDWWDYQPNLPQGTITYMGDRLVPEGSHPTYDSRYGIGHNYRHMTESSDDLISGVIKEQANNASNFVNNMFNNIVR